MRVKQRSKEKQIYLTKLFEILEIDILGFLPVNMLGEPKHEIGED